MHLAECRDAVARDKPAVDSLRSLEIGGLDGLIGIEPGEVEGRAFALGVLQKLEKAAVAAIAGVVVAGVYFAFAGTVVCKILGEGSEQLSGSAGGDQLREFFANERRAVAQPRKQNRPAYRSPVT